MRGAVAQANKRVKFSNHSLKPTDCRASALRPEIFIRPISREERDPARLSLQLQTRRIHTRTKRGVCAEHTHCKYTAHTHKAKQQTFVYKVWPCCSATASQQFLGCSAALPPRLPKHNALGRKFLIQSLIIYQKTGAESQHYIK